MDYLEKRNIVIEALLQPEDRSADYILFEIKDFRDCPVEVANALRIVDDYVKNKKIERHELDTPKPIVISLENFKEILPKIIHEIKLIEITEGAKK